MSWCDTRSALVQMLGVLAVSTMVLGPMAVAAKRAVAGLAVRVGMTLLVLVHAILTLVAM
ncbi:hypothetical protein [Nocardia sp. NPDC052112]|uniref:hypothetical protein n=1 Tax=Nocardia sp. NPDC052112 TaxID=3155646 RepID=UPI00341BB66E